MIDGEEMTRFGLAQKVMDDYLQDKQSDCYLLAEEVIRLSILTDELKSKLDLLRRYHCGDGSISRERVTLALSAKHSPR